MSTTLGCADGPCSNEGLIGLYALEGFELSWNRKTGELERNVRRRSTREGNELKGKNSYKTTLRFDNNLFIYKNCSVDKRSFD